MNIPSHNSDAPPAVSQLQASQLTSAAETLGKSRQKEATREAFQDFVGQTFFAEMIKSLRSSQEPSAYFHGGRAEEIFQGQFDQVLAEELSDASAEKISDPMYELFMLPRRS
jgi:hypothetical protein